MSKKNIVAGQERFDGFEVARYDGKFSGGFDLDEDMGQEMAMDDVITFVVTGRVASVAFAETKNGDIKRTNTFQVTSSTALDPHMASNILNSLSQMPVNGQQTIQGAIAAQDDDDYDDEELATVGAPVPPAVKVTDPALLKFLEGER
jgi:hypothetical protein